MPSRMAILGRYIITPAIFDILKHTHVWGEIQLTDALKELLRQEVIMHTTLKARDMM